jgi:hypothetical protein
MKRTKEETDPAKPDADLLSDWLCGRVRGLARGMTGEAWRDRCWPLRETYIQAWRFRTFPGVRSTHVYLQR